MITRRKQIVKVVSYLLLISVLIGALNLTAAFSAPTSRSGKRKPLAKNIIVMISDGWAFNHLEAVSYYEYGKDARQIYNRFPFQFAISTYMADTPETGPGYCGHGYDPVLAWSDFEYALLCYTDSAAAATALSTGVKTYQGAIGVDLDDQRLRKRAREAEGHLGTSVRRCPRRPRRGRFRAGAGSPV